MLKGKLPVSFFAAWLPSPDEEGSQPSNDDDKQSQQMQVSAKSLQFRDQLHMHLQKSNLCFPCKL